MTKTGTETTSQESTMAVQPPMLSSIPSLHAFDSHSITWQSYRDKISFYFQANRITTDVDKKALFLWSVGDRTYQLLESLVSPRSLIDINTTFKELIELLDNHYDITKNIMTSTFDFYSCYQKAGQSFTEWKAELCEKLRYCGFTSSVLANKPQERALRDIYVMGVKSQKIRQALLKEQDPDLETTEKIIQRAERLEEDVRHFNNSVNRNDFNVAKIHSNQYKQQRNYQPSNDDTKPCDSCGGTNHSRAECKYRDFICNFCKKKGHLERVCRQRKETVSTNSISTIYKLNCRNSNVNSDLQSITIPLQVNNYNLNLDLDTGTYNTIINVKDWQKIGSPILRPSKLRFQSYNGTSLRVKGQCKVKVNYKGKVFNLIMIVVHGTGLPLLGLQWITSMKIDLNDIIHGTNCCQPASKTYSQVRHITSTPRYPVNKEPSKQVIHSLKRRMTHEQEVNQRNKFMPQKSLIRSYRQASHTSTDASSTDTVLQRPNRIGLDRLKPNQSSSSIKSTNYLVGQLVCFLNYRSNKRSYWQPAIITRKFGSIVYEIQLNSGQRRKCHQHQIRHSYSSIVSSSETDCLQDNLFETISTSTTTKIPTAQSSPSKLPKYSRRNRRPPDRYKPPH